MPLDPERIARYSRQLVIPAIGNDGQERLGLARVCVVGASGVAAPGILYLALAGIGTIWIDDPEPVAPADAGQWLYPQAVVGGARDRVATEAVAPRSRFVHAEPLPAEGSPTATLVFAPSLAQSVAAAESSRRAGLPHVVAEIDGDGGAVVTVPLGAPCYSCARSIGSTGRPPLPGAAAVAVLAAQELVLLIADRSMTGGRRIELTRGVPSMRATARLAGCTCGSGSLRTGA